MDLGYHNFRHTHIGTLTLSTRTSKYFRSEARNGPTTIGNHFSYQRCRHWVGKASQSTVYMFRSLSFSSCAFISVQVPSLDWHWSAIRSPYCQFSTKPPCQFRLWLRWLSPGNWKKQGLPATVRIWSWHAIECDLLLCPGLPSCWWHLHHGQNMV